MNTADVVLIVFAISAIFLLMGPFSGSRDVKDIQFRLRRLESKLDALADHAGITVEAAGLRGVHEQLAQGNKIAAIKTYREVTGARLADAKAAVDRMERGEQP
ncbi:hypothetical protein [Nocardioides sp. InS609-2]|uniref:hypothetical protein n=1 Tax=Nocardioides sp. InS609-2 TaxID=2760705 RepID=UPI0020BF42F1|nr:hypothetical protein [Nocardioides sp. InS609-2]